ncbi:hypothetical protein [Rhizorhabdus histidinilytica]|uniref:hypothetical protein n=1 Tax=Rhizorhabdus histidinilytica TaxID=439228 RepID=UPI00321FB7EE
MALMYLAGRMRPIQSDGDGWFAIRPGWIFHGLFVGCTLFVIIFVIALATLSNRSDWREQVTPLLLLLAGFGAAAIWTGWVSYSRQVRWNADQIVVRRRFGSTSAFPWSAVSKVHTNNLSGEYVLTFEDGQKVRVPTMMKGAKQLAEHLQRLGFK